MLVLKSVDVYKMATVDNVVLYVCHILGKYILQRIGRAAIATLSAISQKHSCAWCIFAHIYPQNTRRYTQVSGACVDLGGHSKLWGYIFYGHV